MKRAAILCLSAFGIGAIAQDCSEGGYQNTVELMGGNVQLSYSVILDDDADVAASPGDPPPDGTMSVRMVYRGLAWIGFGTAASSDGFMAGAEAVVGSVDDGRVRKYSMPDRRGIALHPAQTLTDATIEREAGVTTLRYKKRLVEDGERVIHGNGGETTFVWAVGYDDNVVGHLAAGAFTVKLTPCGSGEGGSGIRTVDDHPNLKYWRAHGVLAGLAWGLLAPLAILASVARNCLPEGPLWIQLHKYLHLTVAVCTIVSVVLAIVAINKEGGPSSPDASASETHKYVGFAVVAAMLVQNIGGVARPAPPPPPSAKSDSGSNSDEEDATNKNVGSSAITGNLTVEDDTARAPPAKTTARKYWEIGHRALGAAVLAMCWYQADLGIRLFDGRFGMDVDGRLIWWIGVGVMAAAIAGAGVRRAAMS